MKNKCMKKAVAATLSAAVVLSMLPLSGFMDVSAKAPYVKLNTTFKTLKVGQTYKLKLKNNLLGWKVTKVVSKDSAVCKAVNKKSYVKLTAKGDGRTTVRVTLKTAKRKGANAIKKLSCRVNVKPVEVLPDTPEVPDTPEIETSKTVSDQTELNYALANKNITSITLNTAATSTFTIPEGDYTNVDFTVNAPNADVENHAVFKSVTIQAIKENTWKEKAKGNLIRILARKARVVVDTDASVKNIVYAGEYTDASINLEANGAVENVDLQKSVKAEITVAETADVSNIVCAASDSDVQLNAKGTVRNITLQAKASLNITGSPKTAVAVTAAETAKGAVVRASVKVEITARSDIGIHLEKGAQGSRVEIIVKTVIVNVENKTGATVEVKKADGTINKVVNNSTVNIKDSQTVQGTTNTSGTGYIPSGGSSSSGSSSNNTPVIDLSDISITPLVSGTIVVTSTAIDGVLIENNPEHGKISYGVVTEGSLSLYIKVPESLQIEKIEDDETGFILYKPGDPLATQWIVNWERHVVSQNGKSVNQDIQRYFCVELKESKWISKDGVLTGPDFEVKQVDQQTVDELMKPKE